MLFFFSLDFSFFIICLTEEPAGEYISFFGYPSPPSFVPVGAHLLRRMHRPFSPSALGWFGAPYHPSPPWSFLSLSAAHATVPFSTVTFFFFRPFFFLPGYRPPTTLLLPPPGMVPLEGSHIPPCCPPIAPLRKKVMTIWPTSSPTECAFPPFFLCPSFYPRSALRIDVIPSFLHMTVRPLGH